MATINKRGDRQWRVRIRRGGYPSQGRTFDTKYEAEAWARSIETEMDRGASRDLRRADTTTVAQALDRWMAEQLPHLSANTRRTETSRVRGLKARAISRLSLASVRAEDVTALINERKAGGRKADTIRLDLALLGRVFKLAATAWGLGQIPNPVVAAVESRPPVSSGRTRRVDPDKAAALV